MKNFYIYENHLKCLYKSIVLLAIDQGNQTWNAIRWAKLWPHYSSVCQGPRLRQEHGPYKGNPITLWTLVPPYLGTLAYPWSCDHGISALYCWLSRALPLRTTVKVCVQMLVVNKHIVWRRALHSCLCCHSFII